MFNYIKQNVLGYLISNETAIETIPGYECSVGTTWEDFLADKFLPLSDEQMAFREANPDLSIYNIWTMTMPEPVMVETPERTLEDAKNEKIIEISSFFESPEVNSIMVNGMPMHFEEYECNTIKLQLDGCTRRNIPVYKMHYNDMTMPISVEDGYKIVNEMCYHYYVNENAKQDALDAVNALDDVLSVDDFDYEIYTPETPAINVATDVDSAAPVSLAGFKRSENTES